MTIDVDFKEIFEQMGFAAGVADTADVSDLSDALEALKERKRPKDCVNNKWIGGEK